ncbi:hypothetical protein DESC_780364 [Desulfosarcina cetonica]|nr:hypothetical protein DESC_780364 [Desulfosarcina cetonica]
MRKADEVFRSDDAYGCQFLTKNKIIILKFIRPGPPVRHRGIDGQHRHGHPGFAQK